MTQSSQTQLTDLIDVRRAILAFMASDQEPDYAIFLLGQTVAAIEAVVRAEPPIVEDKTPRVQQLEAAIQHVLNAYGDKGWAKSEMCRYLRKALEGTVPTDKASRLGLSENVIVGNDQV